MKNLCKSLLAILLACAMLIPGVVVMADEERLPVDFTDVDTDDWFAFYVDYCSKNGLVNGMTETTFEPNTALSRAMFVTLLYRFQEAKATEGAQMPFTDVTDGHWGRDAILWAYENEIVNGMTPTTFQPDAKITREQMCTILCRFADGMGYAMPEADHTSPFIDEDEIAEFAYDYVYICYAAGIVNGITEDSFGPRQNATRAQACTILKRFINFATSEYTEWEEENGKVSFEYTDKYGVYAEGYTLSDEDGNVTEYYYGDYEGFWCQSRYQYDANGNMTRDSYVECRVDDVFKYTENYTYDEDGNLLKTEYSDSDGYEYTEARSYDEKGELIKREYEDGYGYTETEKWTYNDDGKLTEYINELGYGEYSEVVRRLRNSYDSFGNPVQSVVEEDGLEVLSVDYGFSRDAQTGISHMASAYITVEGTNIIQVLTGGHDEDGRITKYSIIEEGNVISVEQGFVDGALREVKYTVGSEDGDLTMVFGYDELGAVSDMCLNQGDNTLSVPEGTFTGPDGVPESFTMASDGVEYTATVDYGAGTVTVSDGTTTEQLDEEAAGAIMFSLVLLHGVCSEYEEFTSYSIIDAISEYPIVL